MNIANQHIERATVRAHARSDDRADFWEEPGQQIRVVKPFRGHQGGDPGLRPNHKRSRPCVPPPWPTFTHVGPRLRRVAFCARRWTSYAIVAGAPTGANVACPVAVPPAAGTSQKSASRRAGRKGTRLTAISLACLICIEALRVKLSEMQRSRR
jgi:hypothetical protein